MEGEREGIEFIRTPGEREKRARRETERLAKPLPLTSTPSRLSLSGVLLKTPGTRRRRRRWKEERFEKQKDEKEREDK